MIPNTKYLSKIVIFVTVYKTLNIFISPKAAKPQRFIKFFLAHLASWRENYETASVQNILDSYAKIVVLAAPLLILFVAGCSGGPLLSEVSISPQTITPNADGLEDVTRINYHLNGSADLSI